METVTFKLSRVHVHAVPADLFTLFPAVHLLYATSLGFCFTTKLFATSCTNCMYKPCKALTAAYLMADAMCAGFCMCVTKFQCQCMNMCALMEVCVLLGSSPSL